VVQKKLEESSVEVFRLIVEMRRAKMSTIIS